MSLAANFAEGLAEREEDLAKVQISRTVLIFGQFWASRVQVGQLPQGNSIHEGGRFIRKGGKNKKIRSELEKCFYMC